MPHGYLWQYEWIRWLQTIHAPWLEKTLHVLTLLGTEKFYLLVLPILFWGINKRFGLRLAYVFLTSMYVNGWMKDAFQVVRPVGIPGIQSSYTSTSSGYAFPSGHAQGAMTFWGALGIWIRKGWFWIIVILLAFGIGFSRVYFGLHWPMDVLVGWGIGLILAFFLWWVGQWWTYRQFPYKIRMTLAVVVPAVMILINTGQTSLGYASLLLGIGVGAVLEEHLFNLELGSEWWRRLCAVVIGIAGLIALQWLIKWPSDNALLTVLHYVLVGLWSTLGAPYLFERCGLYHKSAEPAM